MCLFESAMKCQINSVNVSNDDKVINSTRNIDSIIETRDCNTIIACFKKNLR